MLILYFSCGNETKKKKVTKPIYQSLLHPVTSWGLKNKEEPFFFKLDNLKENYYMNK